MPSSSAYSLASCTVRQHPVSSGELIYSSGHACSDLVASYPDVLWIITLAYHLPGMRLFLCSLVLMLQTGDYFCLLIGLQQYQDVERNTRESEDVSAFFEILRYHVVGLWKDDFLGIAYK